MSPGPPCRRPSSSLATVTSSIPAEVAGPQRDRSRFGIERCGSIRPGRSCRLSRYFEHMAVARTGNSVSAEAVDDDQVDEFHVPRSWLLDRLEGMLSAEDCRGVLLTAPPGWGKTSFLAWMLRHRP